MMKLFFELIRKMYPVSVTDQLKKQRDITGIPVGSTPAGILYSQIEAGYCPNCNAMHSFMEGPHGGMSVNIKCRECGHKYNVTPQIGIAEKI